MSLYETILARIASGYYITRYGDFRVDLESYYGMENLPRDVRDHLAFRLTPTRERMERYSEDAALVRTVLATR